jgi:hypothetical protein
LSTGDKFDDAPTAKIQTDYIVETLSQAKAINANRKSGKLNPYIYDPIYR